MESLTDPAVVVLGVCLGIAIAGTVVIITLVGTDALIGSGMGALVAVLASALTWRVRTNGKPS